MICVSVFASINQNVSAIREFRMETI